jgi:hypothetical protein
MAGHVDDGRRVPSLVVWIISVRADAGDSFSATGDPPVANTGPPLLCLT